jgi:hypothetical protein
LCGRLGSLGVHEKEGQVMDRISSGFAAMLSSLGHTLLILLIAGAWVVGPYYLAGSIAQLLYDELDSDRDDLWPAFAGVVCAATGGCVGLFWIIGSTLHIVNWPAFLIVPAISGIIGAQARYWAAHEKFQKQQQEACDNHEVVRSLEMIERLGREIGATRSQALQDAIDQTLKRHKERR